MTFSYICGGSELDPWRLRVSWPRAGAEKDEGPNRGEARWDSGSCFGTSVPNRGHVLTLRACRRLRCHGKGKLRLRTS